MTKEAKKIYPMYMVMPALSFYGIFSIISIFIGFYLSMTSWNIARPEELNFIGIDNFFRLFKEEYFVLALRNVSMYTLISAFFKNSIGLIIALLLDRIFKGRNIFRMIFFLPCVLSPLVVGLVFSFILNPTLGFLNNTLHQMGLSILALDWLGDPNIAIFSVTSVDIWMWTGFSIVIYLAGLQMIPQELKEASAIDGASKFQIFKNVIFPLMMPSINISLVLCIIGGLKVFDLVYVITSGGPGYATEVLNTIMYKALSHGTLGYASAIGVIQFLIIAAITFPTLRVLKRREVEL